MESFEVDVTNMGADIKIACFDDVMSSNLIGVCTLKIKSLCSVFPSRNKIPLYFKNGDKAGEVTIETKFVVGTLRTLESLAEFSEEDTQIVELEVPDKTTSGIPVKGVPPVQR
jgi:hypothetical protein